MRQSRAGGRADSAATRRHARLPASRRLLRGERRAWRLAAHFKRGSAYCRAAATLVFWKDVSMRFAAALRIFCLQRCCTYAEPARLVRSDAVRHLWWCGRCTWHTSNSTPPLRGFAPLIARAKHARTARVPVFCLRTREETVFRMGKRRASAGARAVRTLRRFVCVTPALGCRRAGRSLLPDLAILSFLLARWKRGENLSEGGAHLVVRS